MCVCEVYGFSHINDLREKALLAFIIIFLFYFSLFFFLIRVIKIGLGKNSSKISHNLVLKGFKIEPHVNQLVSELASQWTNVIAIGVYSHLM